MAVANAWAPFTAARATRLPASPPSRPPATLPTNGPISGRGSEAPIRAPLIIPANMPAVLPICSCSVVSSAMPPTVPLTMSENELTEAFEQAWAPFRAAVDKADLDRTTSSGWTVKELLSHVAFWDETVTPVIGMLLRGGDIPADWAGFASGYQAPDDGTWPHFEVHNAREAEWGRAQSNETIIDRLDKAHAQARQAIAALTADEVQDERFRGYVLGEKIAHYEEHLVELTE